MSTQLVESLKHQSLNFVGGGSYSFGWLYIRSQITSLTSFLLNDLTADLGVIVETIWELLWLSTP